MPAESRPDVQLQGAVRFAIVVPYLNDDPDGGVGPAELESAVAGVLAQTVDDWELIVVDDASPSAAVHTHLDALAARDSRIVVLRERVRGGAGHCRNVAIAHARAAQIPIVVFNDADDISHPRRLEVTGDIFATEPGTALAYSHFVPIDQDGVVIATTDYSPAIARILNAIATQPPEGEDV